MRPAALSPVIELICVYSSFSLRSEFTLLLCRVQNCIRVALSSLLLLVLLMAGPRIVLVCPLSISLSVFVLLSYLLWLYRLGFFVSLLCFVQPTLCITRLPSYFFSANEVPFVMPCRFILVCSSLLGVRLGL